MLMVSAARGSQQISTSNFLVFLGFVVLFEKCKLSTDVHAYCMQDILVGWESRQVSGSISRQNSALNQVEGWQQDYQCEIITKTT